MSLENPNFDDDYDAFPLGMPERVVKDMDARWDALVATAHAPEFTIDCSKLADEDFYGAARRAHHWLEQMPCMNECVAEAILGHLDALWLQHGQNLRKLIVAWSNEYGWHVRVSRVELR